MKVDALKTSELKYKEKQQIEVIEGKSDDHDYYDDKLSIQKLGKSDSESDNEFDKVKTKVMVYIKRLQFSNGINTNKCFFIFYVFWQK